MPYYYPLAIITYLFFLIIGKKFIALCHFELKRIRIIIFKEKVHKKQFNPIAKEIRPFSHDTARQEPMSL